MTKSLKPYIKNLQRGLSDAFRSVLTALIGRNYTQEVALGVTYRMLSRLKQAGKDGLFAQQVMLDDMMKSIEKSSFISKKSLEGSR